MAQKKSEKTDTKTYVVLSPIKHDGEIYNEGDEINLTLKLAQELKDFGVIDDVVPAKIIEIDGAENAPETVI